jgi:hypothetical protein
MTAALTVFALAAGGAAPAQRGDAAAQKRWISCAPSSSWSLAFSPTLTPDDRPAPASRHTPAKMSATLPRLKARPSAIIVRA